MVANSALSKNKGRGKSEEKRQQILDAAAHLFLEYGFEKTSMDQVAVAAGVSKQTVYSHFGNKEELFGAIIKYKCVTHSLTGTLFNSALPVCEVLHILAEHFTNLVSSEEALQVKRACVAETPQRKKVAKLYWDAGPKLLTDTFTRYLAEQNAAGTVQIDNPHFAAQQFLHMLCAEAHELKFLDQPADASQQELPDYIKSCVEVFRRAYVKE